ncbi:GP46-like surface antigen, putative, partial [Bodo saltans]
MLTTLLFLMIAVLFVKPCACRIIMPLKTSTIVRSLASPCGVGAGVDGSLIVSACEACGIYKVMPNGPTTVIAGVIGACGFVDGIGSGARFYYPVGVATDAERNVAYIADQANNAIRALDLSTYAVKTVAGSSAGYRDGAFTLALFNYCNQGVFRTTTSGKVLYITDGGNGRVRKANFSSMVVSTVAVVPAPMLLDMSKDGLRLFVSSDYAVIYQIFLTNNSVILLAGGLGVAGFADAVGPAARFYKPRGVSLSHDDSALFVGDWYNYRIRRIELSNQSVTTVTGTGVPASIDGPLLSASIIGASQIMWHCQNTLKECGLVVVEHSTTYWSAANVRWVPMTQGTQSMSYTGATQDESNTLTGSVSGSAQRLSATTSATHEASVTHSLTFGTWTRDASVTLSPRPSSSVALSSSSTASSTKGSASPTATMRPTLSATLRQSESMTLTSMSMTPSSSSTTEVTATKSPPTRSKSSTLFDCNTAGLQATAVALAPVNETVSEIEMQLPYFRNSSAKCALGVSTGNASYPARDNQNQGLRGDPPFVFITSQDVDRLTLLQAPLLIFNFTLASPYQLVYYYVGNVTTPQGTHVSATWSVHPRSGVWHGVVVEAPSIGWVGDGVFPVLLYTELNLLVPLMCGDGHAMLTVVLTIPSPGVPRVLAAEVRRATQTALIVALLATGALSGSALGRILATDSMVLCDADAAGGGGVIDFDLTICNESPHLVESRSAIVSNAGVVAAVGVLLLLLAAVWSYWRNDTVAGTVTAVFLLPSSTTFLAARVASSPCVAVDALLIVLGLLLTVVPVAMLSYLAFNIANRWKCATKKNKDEAHDGERRNHTLKALRTFVHNATQRLWKWRAVIPSDTESMRPAWIVLLEYRVLSYAAIDALFLVAVSSLAVVGGLDVTNEALCRGCSAAVVVLLGAQVGVL